MDQSLSTMHLFHSMSILRRNSLHEGSEVPPHSKFQAYFSEFGHSLKLGQTGQLKTLTNDPTNINIADGKPDESLYSFNITLNSKFGSFEIPADRLKGSNCTGDKTLIHEIAEIQKREHGVPYKDFSIVVSETNTELTEKVRYNFILVISIAVESRRFYSSTG